MRYKQDRAITHWPSSISQPYNFAKWCHQLFRPMKCIQLTQRDISESSKHTSEFSYSFDLFWQDKTVQRLLHLIILLGPFPGSTRIWLPGWRIPWKITQHFSRNQRSGCPTYLSLCWNCVFVKNLLQLFILAACLCRIPSGWLIAYLSFC